MQDISMKQKMRFTMILTKSFIKKLLIITFFLCMGERVVWGMEQQKKKGEGGVWVGSDIEGWVELIKIDVPEKSVISIKGEKGLIFTEKEDFIKTYKPGNQEEKTFNGWIWGDVIDKFFNGNFLIEVKKNFT